MKTFWIKAWCAAFLLSFNGSCSKDQKDQSAEAGAVSDATIDTECGNPAGCSASDQQQAGLPAFCAVTEYFGRTCLRCTPRELPLVRCAEHVVPSFAVNEFCHHKDTLVACAIEDDGFSIAFDYAKKGLREKYYENLPQFLGGIKLVIATTMKNQNEDDRTLIFGIIDLVAKHRQAMFSGVNTQAAKEDITKLLLSKNSKLDAAAIKDLKAYVDGAVDYFSMGTDQDIVTTQDVVAMLKNLLSMLSVGGADLLSSKIDIERIEASLTSEESLLMIEEMLKGLAAQ